MRDPWFPVTCMLVVLLAVWLGIFGPVSDGEKTWVQTYQTLLSAGLASTIASIAAYVAFQNTTRSLSQSQELERNRRQRKHFALRAMLPLALSQIVEYAQNSADRLETIQSQYPSGPLPRNLTFKGLPEPTPATTINLLAEFIEYGDSYDLSLMERTLAMIQIHDARIRGMLRDNRGVSGSLVLAIQLQSSIINAASIYAGAAAFFQFARQLEEEPPVDVSWEDVKSALKNMRFSELAHLDLYKITDDRAKTSTGPFDSLQI